MKITICGSISFYEQMLAVKNDLESLGHEVKLPPAEIADEAGKLIPIIDYYQTRKQAADDDTWVWDRKQEAIKLHFEKDNMGLDIILKFNSPLGAFRQDSRRPRPCRHHRRRTWT